MSYSESHQYSNGNLIICRGDKCKVASTGEKFTDEVEKNLICPKCNHKQTAEGHDHCIQNTPGIKYACCGHGIKNQAYISFEDGSVQRFETTEALHNFLKNT